ncbi:MAG: hypothetical protein K2L25_03790 [Alphaproteobacteria bacterium]|nr:hypothetical protein [Alphaproteobacteria bacterium]
MKKIIFAGMIFTITCFGANASDGGVYLETSNVYSGTANYTRAQTINTTIETRPASRRVVVGRRPCPCSRAAVAAEPVAVKTHTEVTEHYQVYQPVVEYVPSGTYTRRHVVSNVRPCNM